MDVPENVAKLAHTALIIFLPWAASIGYRRFYQGILSEITSQDVLLMAPW
jgi:hypothetical protein